MMFIKSLFVLSLAAFALAIPVDQPQAKGLEGRANGGNLPGRALYSSQCVLYT